MQPDQAPQDPTPSPEERQPAPELAPPKKKGLLLPIAIMIAPVVLIVASILLYAIVNFIMGMAQPPTPASSDGDFGSESSNPIRTVINVLLFLLGSVSIIATLPCLIIGLILLVQRAQK